MAINILSTLSFVPPTFPPAHVVSVRHSAMSSVVMQIGVGRVRSSWAAMDDDVPAGILEKDAAVVFRMLDENGDGSITRAEMQTRLLSCNYPVERIELVFGKIDLNKDGVISADEWTSAYIKHPTLRTAPGLGGALKEKLCADADGVFTSLDADGSGTVSEDEIREHLAGTYDDEFAGRMLKAIDFDSSGEIDQEEFRLAFLKHPSLRSAPGLGGGVTWVQAEKKAILEDVYAAIEQQPSAVTEAATVEAEPKALDGVVVPSWYDSGVRLTKTVEEAEAVEAEVDEVKLTGRKRKAVKAFLGRLVGKK